MGITQNRLRTELLTQNITSQDLISQNSFEDLFSIARKSRPKNAQKFFQRLDSTQFNQPECKAGKEIWLSAQDFTIGT